MSVVFERLSSHHDRKEFDCGVPALNEFLARQAKQNASRNVGVTHVAVSRRGDTKVLGYYTLVTRTVDAAIVPDKKLPRGEIGVVLLGRLAVDKMLQRQGLGRLLLTRAILQVEQASREIGIHALVLDAMDERARTWYLELDFGFKTLKDAPHHLYLPVGTMRQLGGDTGAP